MKTRIIARLAAIVASAALAMAGLVVAAAPAQAGANDGLGASYEGMTCRDNGDGTYTATKYTEFTATDTPIPVALYYGNSVLNLRVVNFVAPVGEWVPVVLEFTGDIATGPQAVLWPNMVGDPDYSEMANCSHSPTDVVGGFNFPVCTPDGIASSLEAISLNPYNYGYIKEHYDVLYDGVVVASDYTVEAGGDTKLFSNPVPNSPTVGDHTVMLKNWGVPVPGMSFNFTITDPCEPDPAPQVTDFVVTVLPPVCISAEAAKQTTTVKNISAYSRLVYASSDDDFYVAKVIAPGATESFTGPIPPTGTYRAWVSVGLLYLYDERQPSADCGALPAVPVLTNSPVVTGAVKVGYALTCNVAYTGATSLAYRWFANGVLTAGTGKTLKLTSAHYNKRMACETSATNAGGTTAKIKSPQTGLVALGAALKVVTKPSISGTSSPGKTLTAKVGSWSPAATSYKYQWQVLKAGKWVNIAKATAKTYKVPKAYDNKYLRVVVTALKAGYNKGVAATARVYI